ncbi:MAG: flagellar filament capping protein FliD [Lachnospiraceae bacterium]|nr:flagellar filament capping protein FliD [Lachnospiraceae bacterium]
MAGLNTNTTALNNVYNFYLTTYAPKASSPYDTHKKSELRNVYNSIVKLNKESPLYLPDKDKITQGFAVGMKENARELRNTIVSLGGLNEADLLNKKAAYSSNEDIVSAEYIGEDAGSAIAPSFEIEVNSLASSQTNMGKFLPNEKADIPADTYSFDVNINDLNYEFQFNINDGESNQDIQNRLARLINNANIGLTADVLTNDNGDTSLKLESTATGLFNGKSSIFTISDDKTSKASGSVDYLGIDFTVKNATNAEYLLNGEERTSYSNDFTVGNQYNVHLKNIAKGESITVGLKTDVESLTDNISQLVRGYNSFIKAASEYNEQATKGTRLAGELTSIAGLYQNDLENVGLNIGEDGTISVDEEALKESALDENAGEHFASVKNFTNSLLRKSSQVSIDPMRYVDQKIVAYKNPYATNNFASPYITSSYSGMMFNSYC